MFVAVTGQNYTQYCPNTKQNVSYVWGGGGYNIFLENCMALVPISLHYISFIHRYHLNLLNIILEFPQSELVLDLFKEQYFIIWSWFWLKNLPPEFSKLAQHSHPKASFDFFALLFCKHASSKDTWKWNEAKCIKWYGSGKVFFTGSLAYIWLYKNLPRGH